MALFIAFLVFASNLSIAQDNYGGSGSTSCQCLIYVSTSGNDSNTGSSTQPVKTLKKALELAAAANPTSANKALIRMESGTYNTDAPIDLISNVIIDGGYTANTTSGVWSKSATMTTINRTT
ncbi:MAG: DUF1565 domain-containing protein, partial [Bacteroidales bacterium]|nr:DUF1565 domain-containing protein [Bacteroidales bacterium]